MSDIKNINIEIFLNEIINNKFDVKSVNDIYIKLIDKYPKISKQCKKVIINFFTKNKQNSYYSNLLEIIKKCPNIREDIFCNINSFIIKEKEFFYPEETDNFKLFRGLINNNLLKTTQENEYSYIAQTNKNVLLLQEKIQNVDIKYKTIIYFFQDEKIPKGLIK